LHGAIRRMGSERAKKKGAKRSDHKEHERALQKRMKEGGFLLGSRVMRKTSVKVKRFQTRKLT